MVCKRKTAKDIVIAGHSCNVKNGKVMGAYNKRGDYKVPYIKSRFGGWENASGDYTPEQLRSRIYRKTAKFA